MTPLHVKTILYNLFCALYYIHSAKVLHRDLKPANVLVDENWAVKICDFGLARSIAPKQLNEDQKEEGNDDSWTIEKSADPQSDHTPMTSSSVDQSKHVEEQSEQVLESKEIQNNNGQSEELQNEDFNTANEAQSEEEQNTGHEEENSHWNIYEKNGENCKDFEPSWDTPRLKFKKPSDKPSKKKTAVAGTKRMAINTNMGILFGKDGLMDKSTVNKEEKKETENKVSPDLNKSIQPESDMRKRDLKDLAKHPTNVMKPIARNTNIKSDLSVHVVTRWYRSPEIILLERDYGPPIDIWSVGWIFAELLTMLKENAKSQFERKPLFPGNSWYPLSPSSSMQASKKRDSFVSKEDQLWVIIDKLGTPSDEDASFISDPGALAYLNNLPKAEKKNFQDMYPFPGEEAIDLLNKMLQFNPYKRINLNDWLEHPFVAEVRDQRKELKAKTLIVLDFEFEDVNKEILREHFVEEIVFFRKFYKRIRRNESGISKIEMKVWGPS